VRLLRGECARGLAPSAVAGRQEPEPVRRGVWFKSHRPLQTKLARPGALLLALGDGINTSSDPSSPIFVVGHVALRSNVSL